MRDPHFRWQAGSSLPCHSFHRMLVSGASISTLIHKKKGTSAERWKSKSCTPISTLLFATSAKVGPSSFLTDDQNPCARNQVSHKAQMIKIYALEIRSQITSVEPDGKGSFSNSNSAIYISSDRKYYQLLRDCRRSSLLNSKNDEFVIARLICLGSFSARKRTLAKIKF